MNLAAVVNMLVRHHNTGLTIPIASPFPAAAELSKVTYTFDASNLGALPGLNINSTYCKLQDGHLGFEQLRS